MKRFDVIVVGAGTGGCMTAKTCAEAGLEVCLIDRKGRKDIGKKVCGDAIGKHHFDDLGLDYPTGEELERRIVGAKLYSPNLETVFHVKSEDLFGFMVNRHSFGQRLLREAMDAGATLLESNQALKPIISGEVVAGVLVRDLKRGSKAELRSRVVVDASGFSAVLRKKLPPEFGIDIDLSKGDMVICYREIRELKEPVTDPEYIELYFNQAITPGGYYWIFAEGGARVNVGLGLAMSNEFPNPKKQLYNHVLSQPLFEGSSIVSGGGGHIPTRRPLDCMVGDGIVVVGDAACQANPVHGGGMGPSMIGGTAAGKTIVEAIERGDVSRGGLWPYNTRYIQSYGAKQAGLDVLRMFLQGLSDDDLNHAMKYRLITEGDLLKASMGEDARLNITEA
ncbi:MAG: geranylgeranyl reductase family protein, partial [Candidatus Bathyarchaeia archaeon]